MRYLNKIVFINSASVQYAEIELDGNVHLIGTQGVEKARYFVQYYFFTMLIKPSLESRNKRKHLMITTFSIRTPTLFMKY